MLGMLALPILMVGLLALTVFGDDDDVEIEDPVEPEDEGVVNGTAGNDIIRVEADGTAGNDIIRVEADGTTVNGGAGDDELISDGRFDGNLLNGDEGNDTIYASGSDVANGGAGDDLLGGGGVLNGGAGNDVLTYRSGAMADGGDGDDVFVAASGIGGSGPVTVDGGSGDDTIGITVTQYTDSEESALRSFSGGEGADTFHIGYSSADADIGLLARIEDFDPTQDTLELDVLGGGQSLASYLELSDVTFAEAGDGSYTDLVMTLTHQQSGEVSQAAIRIEGVTGLTMDNLTFVDPNGDALDTGYVDAAGVDDSGVPVGPGSFNDFGDGNDSVTEDGGGAHTQLGEGDDLYQVTGADGSTISGGDGNDTIEAGVTDGNDALYLGGAGDDLISVEHDSAEISGGIGDDTIVVGGDDIFVEGGEGDDVFIAEAGSGPDVEFRGGAGSDSFAIRAGQTAVDTPDLSSGSFVVDIAQDEISNGFATILTPPGGSDIVLNIDPGIVGEISVTTHEYASSAGEPLQDISVFVGATQVLLMTTSPFDGSDETIYDNGQFDFAINRIDVA